MSKMDALIAQHCPDGVGFKEIGSVIHALRTGLNPRKNFRLNTPNAKGYYATVRELAGKSVIFTDKTDRVDQEALTIINNRSKLKIGDILFSGTGTIGRTALIESPPNNWNIKEGIYAITPNQEVITSKFLLYFLRSSFMLNQLSMRSTGSTVSNIPMAQLKIIKIPIPPLPVQQEIVDILDSFTKLEAELEAELEARQKQYAYYRNSLLSFNSGIDDLIAQHCPDGVEFKELQEIFETKNGYTPSRSNKNFWVDGTVPWFRMDDIRKNGTILSKSLQQITEEAVKGGRLFPANSIIIATSATIGEHALITVPHLSNQRFTSLSLKPEFSTKLNMRFVYYYCFVLGNWCLANTMTSSFSSVNMARFKRFEFPFPPLPVQQEIVDILDSFTKLEAELEAELEARRKQYEHYRNQLLTFQADA